jgi:hypothetical protein
VAGDLLDALNEGGKASLTAKALAARCGDEALADFLRTGTLTPAGRAVLVNTSPQWLPKLLRTVGLNPTNAPELLAGVTALLWGVGYYRAANALGKLAKQRGNVGNVPPKAEADAPP